MTLKKKLFLAPDKQWCNVNNQLNKWIIRIISKQDNFMSSKNTNTYT